MRKEGLNLDVMEQLTLEHVQRMETLKEKTQRARSQVTKLQMELVTGSALLKKARADNATFVVNEANSEEDTPTLKCKFARRNRKCQIKAPTTQADSKQKASKSK